MKLTVQHPHNATTSICQLQPPGGTIGRGQQNDLNLPDTSGEISTLQAIIRMDEGRPGGTILNMSSMGRIAVNDTPLGLSQEALVNEGDRIAVGDFLITIDKSATHTSTSPAPRETKDDPALSATPYDTAAFTGSAAIAGMATRGNVLTGTEPPASDAPETLPEWHPAYQPPAQTATPLARSWNTSSGPSQADPGSSTQPMTSTRIPATASEPDQYPDEHPLGTPINRMPPPAPVANTTVAPMSGNATAPHTANDASVDAQDADKNVMPAPTPPEENPDDIFKDLLSGPGVLPVGGATADDRHPFDMESATNRNHHNPVELLKPEGMHHPSIDGDPLDALPTDGADKDRYTIFSDDSPTTLSKDTALDGHKQDNILETLRRAAHSGYKDKTDKSDDT